MCSPFVYSLFICVFLFVYALFVFSLFMHSLFVYLHVLPTMLNTLHSAFYEEVLWRSCGSIVVS